MVENDIIEESISPWRSQCLVVKQKGDKWRLCIDYSQSVNRYTELDAFPLPRIDELVNELSKHHFFSKYDLKNAYHQIPLHPDDKKLTAFEANGRLLQFKRIPFGLTNAVGAFQRTVTQIIKEDGLVGVYPYLDDVSVAGNTLEELRDRSMKFESALKKRKMTLNEDKTVREVKKMTVLGYEIENGRISPDKDRLQPLLELAEPKTLKELKQVRGLFAYYAKWIVNFSTKIRPLIDAEIFPLSDCAKRAFQTLKKI